MPTPLTALEVKADLIRFWQTRESDRYARELENVVKRLDKDLGDVQDTRSAVLASLGRAIPYYVTRHIGQALAMAAEDYPEWPISLATAPSEFGFLYFEEPQAFVRIGADWYAPIRAVEWEPVALLDSATNLPRPAEARINGFGLIFYSDFPGKAGKIYPCGIATMRAGDTYHNESMWAEPGTVKPDDLSAEEFTRHVEGIKKLVLSAWTFVKQPYMGLVHHRADRAMRKRIGDAFRHEPEVAVITLRKARSEGVYAGEADHEPFDYSCSWIVRGHWRRQRVGPGLSEVKDVYIVPYVKGNLDRPLKAKGDVVYAVRR